MEEKPWLKIVHSLSCKYKIRYATYDIAREWAIKFRKKYGKFLRVYECLSCHDYHLGHDFKHDKF